MNVMMRIVGEALTELQARKQPQPKMRPHVEPFAIQVGDFVTHPLFPDRALRCVARHFNLVAREVELYLDFADEPEGPGPTH